VIGVFSFFLTAAFVPGIAGAAVAPRWGLLAIFLPWMFPAQVKWTLGHLAVCTFLAWVIASLVWSPDHYGGALAVIQWLLIGAAFFVGANTESLRSVYIGSTLGLSLSSTAAVAQMLGWRGLDQFSVPGGLFFNPNFMAEAAALVVVALVLERIFWLIPLVLPALLLPGARGALLAVLVALTVAYRSRKIAILGLLAVFAAAAFFYFSGYRISSIEERFAIWRDALDGMSLLGRGVGSFYYLYPSFATRTDTYLVRPEHAHNDLLEAAFEFGPASVLLLLVGFFALRSGRNRAAAGVLVAFGVEALFGFPLHEPVTAFMAALVAGHLCGSGNSLRSVLDDWRVRRCLWRANRTLRFAAARCKHFPA
jgi:hypothetical protein